MGKVNVTMTVMNRGDQVLAERGLMPAEQVRSITLQGVMVDTGATTLCLPANIIEQLGLPLNKTVEITTALGISQARIFEDAKIVLLGREGTFECLELPGDANPLLGVIPLEALGLELDLSNQTLRLLPTEGRGTYYTVYQAKS